MTRFRLYVTISPRISISGLRGGTLWKCLSILNGRITGPVAVMITPEEQRSVLARAYVPEHSVELITMISGGEPILFDDYFCCQTQHGVIVIGYPLQHDFALGRFEGFLHRIIGSLSPGKVSLIAPQAPVAFKSAFVERDTDTYYTLDLPAPEPRGSLGRMIRKAKREGIVERGSELTEAHHELAREFVELVAPPPRIAELLFRMWDYIGKAKDGEVFSVWDRHGRLAAFFVVDFAPQDFATYVIGCHSRRHYVQGASDLLMSEMIKVSAELGKRFIHLGIGVNAGIRAFKEKWGGIASRPYELCELALRKPSLLDAILGNIGRS